HTLTRLIEAPRPAAPEPTRHETAPPEPEPAAAPRLDTEGPLGADPEIGKLGSELAELDRKYLAMRSAVADSEFTGGDAGHLASVTLGFTGGLRRLELHSGVERKGGRSLAEAIIAAWNIAERERAHGAE